MRSMFSLLFLISISCSAKTRDITLVNHETDGVKQWLPGTIIGRVGESLKITLINNVPSGDHGFAIPDLNIEERVRKNKPKTILVELKKAGLYNMICHYHQAHVGGQLLVLEKEK